MLDQLFDKTQKRMDQAIETVKKELTALRTGRASTSIIENVSVDYYGSPTPMQQLASFTTPEARTILIKPFDAKAMHGIERAIRDSDLGVNPSNDGIVIRCILPVLTEDRRREYIKLAHHKAEEARVSIRNIRRKAKTDLEHMIKDGDIGEDDGVRAEKELEALTKKYVETVDHLLKGKEAELLEV